MQQSLAASQASYQIQPRVFYEDFHDKVLYVQDVRSGTGAANWKQIFMADVSDPASPKITTAESATVVNDSALELMMRLRERRSSMRAFQGTPISTTSRRSPQRTCR